MSGSKIVGGRKSGSGALQSEKFGLVDAVIAATLAAITLAFSFVWRFPGLVPSLWNDAVVAAGVRPAASILPGYLRAVESAAYGAFGVASGVDCLNVVGHFALAAIAISVYASLREVLAFVMRARPQFSKRRTIVMQLASALGALAFVCSDAVWSAGQCFSESLIMVLLVTCALEFYFLFLRKGGLKFAYGCSLMLGLLAAESPVGLVLLAVFIGIYGFILKVMPVLESPFFKPAVIAVGKWHMTFLFVAAFASGIALNCYTFEAHSGLSAVGAKAGDVPLMYFCEYWASAGSAADILGWLLFGAVAVAPFVITLVRFPDAADEEQFLPYPTGVTILVSGVFAAAQSCSLPALWYWTYGTVNSRFLLCMGGFLSASTLACAVTILGVDALCRDHRRLAGQVFGSEPDDGEDSGIGRSRSTEFVRLLGLVLVPSAIVFAILPGRVKSTTRAMLAVIGDAVSATVDEAGDAEFIFTDGSLDAGIELESARRGGGLKCVSLNGGGDPLAVSLRLRGLGGDKDDVFAFGRDGGTGLRTWVHDRPERLARCAVQLGFECWKRDGRPIPQVGGFVSRPGTPDDPAARRESVARAGAIARRVLEIRSGQGDCSDRSVGFALSAVQWRLARMCGYRAELADLADDAAAAISEEALAKELDDANPVYRDLVAAVEKRNGSLMSRLTPLEGLQLALVRAEFSMARFYAETILAADPAQPDANFAMGMSYVSQRQLVRAEEYLKRALIGKPREPSIYNNLAMVQLELGKLDAALVNVEKALALIPGSSEVLDTKKQILRRRAEGAAENSKETK